jgi:hypothetical protein
MTLRPINLLAPFILFSALAGAAAAQTPPPGGAPGGGMGGGMGGFPRSTEEVQPWAERLFGRFDANQDGAITEDELAVLDSPNAAAMGGSRFRTMILAADANGDARVSSAEWTSAAQQMFERMSGAGAGAGRPGGGRSECRESRDRARWSCALFFAFAASVFSQRGAGSCGAASQGYLRLQSVISRALRHMAAIAA